MQPNNAYKMPKGQLILAALAGGVDAVILAFMLVLALNPNAGPEGLIFLFIIPLPAYALGGLLTYFMLKGLSFVSKILAQAVAVILVLFMVGFGVFYAAEFMIQNNRFTDEQSVTFEVFLPNGVAGIKAGARVVETYTDSAVDKQSQSYVPKVYSTTYSTAAGQIELNEFPKTAEFNPPTDCGSPIARSNFKGFACSVVGRANGADIYLAELSDNSGMSYMLFTERSGTVIAVRTYDIPETKAKALEMMKSMRPAPEQKKSKI